MNKQMTNETALTDEHLDKIIDSVKYEPSGYTAQDIKDEKRFLMRIAINEYKEKFIANGGWIAERKPIEDAPRDGTRILTYCPKAIDYKYHQLRINFWKNDGWFHSNQQFWPPTHYYNLPQKAGE